MPRAGQHRGQSFHTAKYCLVDPTLLQVCVVSRVTDLLCPE